MVLSLWAGTVGRGPPLIPARSLARAHGPESLNHQGRGTQWSVGHGGGLVRWVWRALAVQGLGDLGLPDPDKDRHQKGKADGLRGLGRDGPLCERSTDGRAWYGLPRSRALSVE